MTIYIVAETQRANTRSRALLKVPQNRPHSILARGRLQR